MTWCEECHDLLRSGEVPRVCEPWDADLTPPEERYGELFRAAEIIRRAGIEDENRIIPTLVFAARSFELQNLGAIREQLAEAEVGSERWMDLKGTVRRAFDTFEIVGVHDGVPIIYSRPFKLRAHVHPETGIVVNSHAPSSRPIHRSAWNRNSTHFAQTALWEVRHTLAIPSYSNDMATWHTDLPCSRLILREL